MKRFLTFILFVILIGAGYLYLYQPEVFHRLKNQSIDLVDSADLLPPPLRSAIDEANSHLTLEGTVNFTNQQREAQGLLPLNENPRLNEAARLKVQDMFARQYFEHESPTGEGPSDLADRAGYKYVLVGENLALGNFKNDEALVIAWMNSPGHRENILNKRYQEIGVAVARGMFEGKQVWLAVQEFGRPLSSCPQPDTTLKSQIDTLQTQIDSLQAELTRRKEELDRSRDDRATYNRKVEEYNSLVKQVNSMIGQAKYLVEQYNAQIRAFNACLEG